MNDNSKTIVALIAGLAAGAALGILFAPEKGEETQDKLSRSLADLKDKIVDKAKSEIERLTAASEELSEKARSKFNSYKDDAKQELTEKIEEA